MALLRWIYLRKLVPIEELITSSNVARGNVASPFRETPQDDRRPPQPEPGRAPSRVAASAGVMSGSSRTSPAGDAGFKDSLFAEIRKSKAVFYNTVVAQAQKVEVAADRVTFSFNPAQRALRDAFDQNRAWLESIAQQVTGRKIAVASVQSESAAPPSGAPGTGDVPPKAESKSADRQQALREQALADAGVQALLEVFPAEIRDVEEM
jgi:hypothetical protein